MSMPSASRSIVHGGAAADGTGANGSTASTVRLGHRQGNQSMSRGSIAPSDSVSQAGGMSASRSTNKVFQRVFWIRGLMGRDNLV